MKTAYGVSNGLPAMAGSPFFDYVPGWRESPNRTVILSQFSNWRENPPDFQSAIRRALLPVAPISGILTPLRRSAYRA